MEEKRILLVDEVGKNSPCLVEILKGAGFQIEATGDGEEGIAKLKEHTFDLLLLGLQIKTMRGVEVLKKIRRLGIGRDCPTVIISSSPEDLSDISRAKELGAIGYIKRSAPSEEILFRVEMALQKSLLSGMHFAA